MHYAAWPNYLLQTSAFVLLLGEKDQFLLTAQLKIIMENVLKGLLQTEKKKKKKEYNSEYLI